MSYTLVRVTRADRLDLDAFARAAGLHADLVRRFVALGLLEAFTDEAGRMWLPASQLAVTGRIQRLRAALPVNYAALGLVIDLLDRIAELEAALRRRPAEPARRTTARSATGLARRPHNNRTGGDRTGGEPWIRTD
ncbi:chaperone modulator CbpM [Thermopolyspora sp. NPDC052614]|uniref:chaperone modulator CbpM n=1 Tax=Thermopolyspora sp. NPDC052614 TaxID=3155682 RepID=UPI00344937C7